jgi:LysM repeat protein
VTSHLCKLGTVAALVIAAATATATAAPAPASTVRVTAGDTLEAIAARTGTSVAALQQANPQVRPEALQVG